jgi:DNA-binding response OmpR family regulator
MRVLLVEDDVSVAEPLIDGLARYGIRADHVTTGAAAPAGAPPDLVLFDLGERDTERVEACRKLRGDGAVPMILLTGRGGVHDRSLGRELGVEDLVAQPYRVPELVARMRAVARRGRRVPAQEPIRRYGPLAIDTRSRQIRLHGVPIPLAPKEYDLLVLLATDPGAVVARRHILDTIWEPNFLGPGKTLDFHVASLRSKLGDAGWIENRRGVGFRLVVPA